MSDTPKPREFGNFAEFWPFYLSEHMNATSRRWHFAGIVTGIGVAVAMPLIGRPLLMPLGLVPGYLFAWVGHFGFEKNIPASFSLPYLSLLGDLNMFRRTLMGKLDQDYVRLEAEIERHLQITREENAAKRGHTAGVS